MRRDATATTLTTRQEQAIQAIVATGDVTVAAQSVGVNRATLYRWRKQPSFVAAVHGAEADGVEDLSRMLVRLGRTTVATPPATRVRAADATLTRLLQLRELATLEQRVAALEASAGEGR
jgi:transposase-like protein